MNDPLPENSSGAAGSARTRVNLQIAPRQRGMALISGILLLLVMTILGISMFRSFGIQARIAGNTREKQRALHAAEGAQTYAEWWVSGPGGGNATMGTPCSGVVSITKSSDVRVCSNQILPTAVTTVPWMSNGNPVGFVYNPVGMSTTGPDSYAQLPSFYVAYVSGKYDASSGTQVSNYRVDATGAGGTTNAVAVVESTYQVAVTYTTQLSKTKFYSLTGP
jgi:type IV pilus assembly protein PilX